MSCFPVWCSCYTLSYHSLSTADVVTEQVLCMCEVPWFCSSVLYAGYIRRITKYAIKSTDSTK